MKIQDLRRRAGLPILLEDMNGIVKIKNGKIVASAARNDVGSFLGQRVISSIEDRPDGYYKAASDKQGRVRVSDQLVDINKVIQKAEQQVEAPLRKYTTKTPGIKGSVEAELMINAAAERKKQRTKIFLTALKEIV